MQSLPTTATPTRVRRSLALGVIFAPLAPWALYVLLVVVSELACSDSGRTGGGGPYDSCAFVLGIPLSYLSMLLGVPCVRWLERRGWLSWLTVSGGAALIGAGVIPGLCAIIGIFLPVQFLVGAIGGLVSGLAFALAIGLFSSSEKAPPS